MKEQKYLPNFLTVFDQKLNNLRKLIKKELDKPKKERKKADLKRLLKQAKELKVAIHTAKKATAQKCPHCGEVL